MRTTRRRRLDVFLLGAGALAGGAVTVIGGVVGDEERVTGMWVGAEVADDGSAALHEVIDYDFGFAQDKHGIIREIPGLTTDSKVDVRSDSAPDAIDRKQMTFAPGGEQRSEEHTSELQSLMRTSYAVFCLNKKNHTNKKRHKSKTTT